MLKIEEALIPVFLVIIALSACSQSTSIDGVYVVNLTMFTTESTTDSIVVHHNGHDLIIKDGFLVSGIDSFSLLETSSDIWDSLIPSLVFEPEYDLFYVEGTKSNRNDRFLIDEQEASIEISREYLQFFKYEDFLKNHLLGLKIENPLRVDHSDQSEIVDENYSEYYYEFVKIKGNWIFLKTEPEASGVDIKGWAKWKCSRLNQNGSKLCIEVIYSI
jgi:hypothetical protein